MIYLYLALSAILGLIMGSFLTMLIPRLHHDQKGIFLGRSHCEYCRHNLRAYDLVPLLSYLALKGHCRYCKKPISAWYPLIEITTATTFVVLFLYSLNPWIWLWHALLFSILIFIFFYDLRYKEIHDAVMFPAIFLAFAAAFVMGDLVSSMIGGLIGLIFFGLQFILSRGQWIGSGDLRIGAFIGLMLGWEKMIIALIAGYIIGSFIGVGLLATRKADRKTALPLGPFLVIGTVIAFFFGENLIEWYVNTLLL